ncbi:MAG: nucleoside triphosphate pyrophosphohydrolase [Candidatus Thorarchaeota archaeon]
MPTEKLVRDRIPEIIREKGTSPQVRVADKNELDLLMRQKVVEEAEELLESGAIEEVVDLLEILSALISLREFDDATFERMRYDKRKERGGFEKGYVLRMD